MADPVKKFGGLTFRIDRPKGYVKEWPQKGWTKTFTYPVDYGYLPRHTGEDGEGLDFFVGDDPQGHLESFQKLKRDAYGRRLLDETKFLVGVTDAERETIYRLYGDEVWHRRVYRDMEKLIEALPKFKAGKKVRYAEKTANGDRWDYFRTHNKMNSELYDVLMEKDAFNFGRIGEALQGAFKRFQGHAPTPMPLKNARPWSGYAQPAAAHVPAAHAPTALAPQPRPAGQPPPLPSAGARAVWQPPPLPTSGAHTPAVSTPFAPGKRDAEAFDGTRYTHMGLGGVLAHLSPEGRFLQHDPRFHHLVYNHDGGLANDHIEELDALAHHLFAHQQSGGSITPDVAHSIMQSPGYHNTVSQMKTSSLRRTKIAVLARYGFKQADAKFADIDKRIMGEIAVVGPHPVDWAFSRLTGPQLTSGAETSSTPGARE